MSPREDSPLTQYPASGRALVIGSQIAGLRGVDNDVRRMAEMLSRRGFVVDVRTGASATRAGILEGYDRLIAHARPHEPAVVYFAGHGFESGSVGLDRLPWLCIAPTDLGDGTADDWRGITAWELSLKQAQLTQRTRNVTVIFDTGFTSQMSRDAAARDAIPRALPHPVRSGFAEHLEALRARYGSPFSTVDPLGNPDAVVLSACRPSEAAYEYHDADGGYRGAFTEALLEVLADAGNAPISWAVLADAIRSRVLRRFVAQRPEVEGPLRRLPFSLEEDDRRGAIALATVDRDLRLEAGRLTGVVPGDVYGVMPGDARGYDARSALARVKIVAVSATTSTAQRIAGDEPLPADAVAFPLTTSATRRPVAILAPANALPAIEAAIAATPTLRIAEPQEAPVIATLRLAGDALTIEDAMGPLFPAARFPADLDDTIRNIVHLGLAQSLRELEGEYQVSARELAIEFGVVDEGQQIPLPDHGAALGLRDRVYVKVANRSHRPLFIHIFNIGMRGDVFLLTGSVPGGVVLDDRYPEIVLGRTSNDTLTGLYLSWPDGLPMSGFPRLDELLVIATAAPADLRVLETRSELAKTRSSGQRLQDLVGQLRDGLRRDIGDAAQLDGYFVKRLSYMLHPREAALGGLAFGVDDNPTGQAAAREPAAWLTPGVDAPSSRTTVPGDAPRAIAIRLVDLAAESKRPFSAGARIDALICTRSETPGGGYTAWTLRYREITDGYQGPARDTLVFVGEVRDFVDIALFVSRDAPDSPDLATLLADRADREDLRAATAALSTGAVPAPWVAAVGASAALTRMAYELLRGIGESSGLYRTSFLGREQFGVGRHPANGRYRGHGLSFALVIEPIA